MKVIDETEQDWYEQFVINAFASLGTLYDKDGNEVEGYELEPTEEQIRKIAQKFSNDRGIDNLICELNDICIDYIVSELGLST